MISRHSQGKGALPPTPLVAVPLSAASIGSVDFEVTDTSLTKTYEINSKFPTEFLEAGDADQCLAKAQDCAFERMARFGGAVGPARAAALLDECLAEFGTDDGNSCLEACDKQPDHGASSADLVCDAIVLDMQFYADQSGECLKVLDDCDATDGAHRRDVAQTCGEICE